MAHLTRKKKKLRDKNRLKRGMSGFNTGTRSMGFESNQQRKEQRLADSVKDYLRKV